MYVLLSSKISLPVGIMKEISLNLLTDILLLILILVFYKCDLSLIFLLAPSGFQFSCYF